jgi:hypothetical protein
MLMRPKQEFRRFTLRYLSVGSRMITAEGQQITLPSTEEQLREFFQQAPDFAETQPQPLILPDRQNNALLIRGTEAQLATGRRTACVVGSAEPFDSYRSTYF